MTDESLKLRYYAAIVRMHASLPVSAFTPEEVLECVALCKAPEHSFDAWAKTCGLQTEADRIAINTEATRRLETNGG